jgi:hypothetical protein
MTRGQFAWTLVLFGTTAIAQDYGPDTCIPGYVWREAFPGDHVCVDPTVRAQAAEDNRLAAERREPGGGAYGPDTCRAGFVWREAGPDDHVCVTPRTRSQAAIDNRAARSRYARASGAAARAGAVLGTQAAGVVAAQPAGTAATQSAAAVAAQPAAAAVAQPAAGAAALPAGRVRPDIAVAVPAGDLARPQVPQTPPPAAPGSTVKRGFDENGDPYVQTTLPDGSIRREQRKGITVIKPDGTSQFYRPSYIMSNAQPPTPPELPSDPAQGRAWVSFHNEELKRLIGDLVANDESEMQKFGAAEAQAVGSDLFRQIEYRTRVIEALVGP